MGINDAPNDAPTDTPTDAPTDAPTDPPEDAAPSSPRRALWALAFGNIVIGTGALAFVGMLDTIASDLRESPAAIGLVAGMFSLGICLSGPLLGALTSRYDRRVVLTASLVLFAIGHFAAATAAGYWTLLAIRVATSFAGAIFTPQAAATASLLVRPERRAPAIAFIFLGWAIAAVLGVPAGSWIAATIGWREAMVGIGVLSLIGAGLVWSSVPSRSFVGRVGAAAWRAIVVHPTLLRVVSVTALYAGAQFTLYSYIVIAYRDTIHPGAGLLAVLLSLMGIAGFGGNLVAGRFANRLGPASVITIALSSMTAAFALWAGLFEVAAGPFAWTIAIASALLWGAGNFATNSMQQVRLVDLAPPLAPVSVALNTSAIYLGQFVGAAVGGLALAHPVTVPATRALPWIALPLSAAAIAISIFAQRRIERMASSVLPTPASPT